MSNTKYHNYRIFIGIICLLLSNTLISQYKEIVYYKINATLNVQEKSILGKEIITWYNDSAEEINDLQFHLYLNGFKNEKSTYFKERGSSPFNDNEWGWIDIISFKILNGNDLTKNIEYFHPENNKDDQTVMRVKLPEAIKPHQKISVEIEFYSKLPKAIDRVGYKNDFFFLCQWYPKLGVYEEKGERGVEKSGWNCHEFHAASEFFADFGTFDVTLTVPLHFVVGASGAKLKEKDNLDGSKTLRFLGEKIHDFAWTADPNFIVFNDHFQYYGLDNVEIIYLCQPGHEFSAPAFIKSTKDILKYFGLWYGSYPYKTLTIVDPAKGANSGGMEYPNLITGGTSYLFKLWPFNKISFFDIVIIHGAGHQWWYGMVGNNEFEDAWLDEGINTYASELKVAEIIYPEEIQSTLFKGLKIKLESLRKIMYLEDPKSDPIQKYCWDFFSGGGRYYYSKAALMLKTLEGYIGQEMMAGVMKTFFEKWKFKHPGPGDFIEILEEITGEDFTWFFDQFLYGTNVLDYSISKIEYNKIAPARGMYDRGKGKINTFEYIDNIDLSSEESSGEFYKSSIYVKRLGEVVFPVEVLVKFENNKVIKEKWDGKERWKIFEYVEPGKVLYATVDPENKIPLDINITNNSKTTYSLSSISLKYFLKWTFRAQNILEIFAR